VLAEDMAHLASEGLIDLSDDHLRLTDEGVLYGDYCGRYLGAGLRRTLCGDARPIRA
jgi:oxygen-independent coproporphyrinogen III oxidase